MNTARMGRAAVSVAAVAGGLTLAGTGGAASAGTGPSVTCSISAMPCSTPASPILAGSGNLEAGNTRLIVVERNGSVFVDGAESPGLAGAALNRPLVGEALTQSSDTGYWLVASDGGVFSFGGAGFYGSTGNLHLNRPIVGMASTPDGLGYWLVASDGGVFSFGDAGFYGSTGNLHLNQPIVGMAPSADGHGYQLVAADGGVFTFGDAGFYGSTGGLHLNRPVVQVLPTPDDHGYWLVAADGGVFAFGDAPGADPSFVAAVAGLGGSVVGAGIEAPPAATGLPSGLCLDTTRGDVLCTS